MHGRNNGKKLMTLRIVKHTLEISHHSFNIAFHLPPHTHDHRVYQPIIIQIDGPSRIGDVLLLCHVL